MTIVGQAMHGDIYNQVDGSQSYTHSMTAFAGADIKAVVGGVEIGELQQVSWAATREKGGNYVLGDENPIGFSRGRRFVAGMFMLGFFSREALASAMRTEQARAIGGLRPSEYFEWHERIQGQGASHGLRAAGDVDTMDPRSFALDGVEGLRPQLASRRAGLPRGLTRTRYADQLMPFNITITAANEYGVAARCAILGIEIMNMETGFAIETMQADHRYSFLARDVTEWVRIGDPETSGAGTTGPGLRSFPAWAQNLAIT